MRKQLIMKSQKNQIFQLIKDTKLNPSEFEWIECNSEMVPDLRVSKLIHRPTGFYCMFDLRSISLWTEYSPGHEATIERKESYSWGSQLVHVQIWLVSLSRELKAPDLWGAISQETKLAEAASSPDMTNEPFTLEEQKYISTQLSEIKKYLIETQSLSRKHAEFVGKRFDYLEKAGKRLGRQDWITALIGILFTIVVQIGLDSNAARELFRFVADNLRQLLRAILSLP